MIDWSKLKPYPHDKRKSFEGLCYHVAKKLYSQLGHFTPIDDSGGGDGVEFFLTMPDGTEWGWQAKFYFPQLRLNATRKANIKNSLAISVDNHPTLTKWYLCTPTDFEVKGRNNELTWFNSTLQAAAPHVELVHWGDSDFSDMLSDPQMVGKRLYFFGELELSLDWFTKQVTKQLENVRSRFLPTLHTETDIDLRIHCLAGDRVFLTALSSYCSEVTTELQHAEHAVQEMRRYASSTKWQNDVDDLSRIGDHLFVKINSVLEELCRCREFIAAGRIEEARITDLTPTLKAIADVAREYRERYDEIYSQQVGQENDLSNGERRADEAAQRILSKLYEPLAIVDEIAASLHRANDRINDFKKADLHVFGDAGIGKTHIICHACQERVQLGLPSILLLGGPFTRQQTIERRILDICDVPANYSWSDFLAALEACAEAHGTKVLIAIDALNDGENVEVWRQELSGFIAELARSSRVVLVTTCRTSFRQSIWDDNTPINATYAHGFHGGTLEEAITRYFNYYKLRADLTLAPIEQFQHPIYLRIFCESQNPDRITEKEVYVGQQSLFKVFEQFLTRVDDDICRRLSRVPRLQIVLRTLMKLAQAMWERNARYMGLEDTLVLLDGSTSGNWNCSLTRAVLDEGLLIERDWLDGDNRVSFTYDLLGGYLISKVLLEGLDPTNPRLIIESPDIKRRLTSDDYGERHPLHEDILRCMCALFPQYANTHIYALTEDEKFCAFSIDALFEMEPAYIGEDQRDALRRLFSKPRNREALLRRARSTAFNASHPLNIEFWDELLLRLPIPERDISWTEHVRSITGELLEDIEKFEEVCGSDQPLSDLGSARLYLAAHYYRWLLTSTHRLLRDRTTKALYWYGRRFPERLFDLTLASLTINDPYVPERLLAASYGAAMTFQSNPVNQTFRNGILPSYARSLFDAMFAKNASHATTHALMRDFAKHTIDMALVHQPKLLNAREHRRLLPPYRDGGIRKWGESGGRNQREYQQGPPPLDMDFENYTLGALVHGRAPYDYKHPGFQKVRANILWRFYDLGYSLETFGEIDREIGIASWQRQDESGRGIDRYAQKYVLIAYYELYGFLQDKGLRPYDWSKDDGRPSDIDIDPSFPDQPHRVKIITPNFLGDRSTTLGEWIDHGGLPDIAPTLILEEVENEQGPWVLIDGYVNQQEEESKRGRFAFLRGFMVDKRRSEDLFHLLQAQNLGGRWLCEIPEDYYTFAGEIPWCESFQPNGMTNLHFDIGHQRRKIPQTRLRILGNGRELSDHEVVALLERLPPAREQHQKRRMIAKILEQEQVTVERVKSFREEEERLTKKVRVLIPVRRNKWESYHSRVNPSRSIVVPARELTEELGLWLQLPSWDISDAAGHRACVISNWGRSWPIRHDFIYFRQDLLDRFLRKKRMALVWAVWGERQICRSWLDALLPPREDDVQPYKIFQQIFMYKDGHVTTGNPSERSRGNRVHGSDGPTRLPRGNWRGNGRFLQGEDSFLRISEGTLFSMLQSKPTRRIRKG